MCFLMQHAWLFCLLTCSILCCRNNSQYNNYDFPLSSLCTAWTKKYTAKLTKGEYTPQKQETNYINIGLLRYSFKVMVFWLLKKCLKCPVWVSTYALQETDFWDSTFFCHAWLGLFTTSYERPFQNFCKTHICRLGFIYGSCMMVFDHTFFLHVKKSWAKSFQNNGWDERPTAWPVCSPHLNPLNFYLREYLKSTVYAKEVSDVQDLKQQKQSRFDLIHIRTKILQWVWQSLFRYATSCTEAWCRECEHFLKSSEGCNSKTTLQEAYIHNLFLVLWCRFTFCRSGCPFFLFTLHTYGIKISLVHQSICCLFCCSDIVKTAHSEKRYTS